MNLINVILLSLVISFQAHATLLSSLKLESNFFSSQIEEQDESITLVIDYDNNQQYVIERVKTQSTHIAESRYQTNSINNLSILFQGKDGYNEEIARDNIAFDIYLQGDFNLPIFDKIDLFVFKINGIEFKSFKDNLVTKMNGRYGLIKIGDTERIHFTKANLISINNNKYSQEFDFFVHDSAKISNHLVKKIVESGIPTQAQLQDHYHSIHFKIMNKDEEYVFVNEKPKEVFHQISYVNQKQIKFQISDGLDFHISINRDRGKDNIMKVSNNNQYLQHVIFHLDNFMFSHNYEIIEQTQLMHLESINLKFF